MGEESSIHSPERKLASEGEEESERERRNNIGKASVIRICLCALLLEVDG